LLAFAMVSVGIAVVLAFFAVRPGPDPAAAVLDVEDAVASAVPATVPPLVTMPPASSPPTSPRPANPSSGPTTTTIPLSPLAALVGERGSAVPPEIEPRLRPVGLRIDRIFVDDPVVTTTLWS
jgi:hypothetical protein